MGFFPPVNPFEFYTKLRLAKEIAGAYRELAELSRTTEPHSSPYMPVFGTPLSIETVFYCEENAEYHTPHIRVHLPWKIESISRGKINFRMRPLYGPSILPQLLWMDIEDLNEHLAEVNTAKDTKSLPSRPFYRLSREEKDELDELFPWTPTPHSSTKR